MTSPDSNRGPDEDRYPPLTARDKAVLAASAVFTLAVLWAIITFWDRLVPSLGR